MTTPNQETSTIPAASHTKKRRSATAKLVSKPRSEPPTGKRAPKSQALSHPQSKQDRVVAMLRRPEGATVAAIMKTTGWQKHSVRGFFAGVVRRKLGLYLISAKTDGKQIYRITEGKAGKTSKVGKRIKTAKPPRKQASA